MKRIARRRPLLPSLVLAVALAVGCTTVTNPVTGEREFTTMSPEREAALGRQAAEQVAQQIGIVDDPALTAYVRQIGDRVAAFSPRKDVQYQFFVADMPEANAFALPGGYIYVSRGLLVLTNEEAELAGVLGHEVGHVAARHAAQRETRQMGVGIASVLGTLAGAAIGGAPMAQAVGQLSQVAGAGLIASYGREQERQSDDVGQRMSAAAGWDPAGITAFLATLGRETELRLGQKRRPSFLDSHPSTDERVQNTIERARTLSAAPTPPIVRNRRELFGKFRGLLVGPDPKGGVFQDGRFLHPVMDFAMRFPSGWQTVNQPSVVGAQSPQNDALVKLELQAGASDPQQAALAFLRQNQLAAQQSGNVTVGGMRAYRALVQANSQQGALALHLTWVAHPKGMFRISGITPVNRFNAYVGSFNAAADSFARLNSAQRAAIKERVLEVATARGGETLTALGRRTRNVWTPKETAVANGLQENVRLASGQPVKIAIERRYTAR